MAGGHFAAAECAVQCSAAHGGRAEDVVGGFRIATSRAKEYGIGVPILNFLLFVGFVAEGLTSFSSMRISRTFFELKFCVEYDSIPLG
jgi:hypothetical protein